MYLSSHEEMTAVHRFPCPDCGRKNDLDAQYCETCEVSIYVDLESPWDAVRATAQETADSADYPANTESMPGVVRGQVVDIESGFGQLDLWIETYDAMGGQLSEILVEMRAWTIVGAIEIGDWVEISGTYTLGEAIRPREVKNLTTGFTIETSSVLQDQTFMGVVLLIIKVALILIAPAPPTYPGQNP